MPGGRQIEQIIERQVRYWEVRRRLADRGGEAAREALAHLKEGPWITVSKQWGSGGVELAQRIGEEMGWQVFDREILIAIAENTKMKQTVLSRMDERAIGAFNDYILQLLVPSDPGQLTFLREMVHVVWGLARQGNAVIVGRGANWFLNPQYGLRVRAIAPLDYRMARIADEAGDAGQATKKEVLERDAEQASFIRRVYGKDIADPEGYDLVLNMQGMEFETAVEVVKAALRKKLRAAD
jgi:cytidylate kinase